MRLGVSFAAASSPWGLGSRGAAPHGPGWGTRQRPQALVGAPSAGRGAHERPSRAWSLLPAARSATGRCVRPRARHRARHAPALNDKCRVDNKCRVDDECIVIKKFIVIEMCPVIIKCIDDNNSSDHLCIVF